MMDCYTYMTNKSPVLTMHKMMREDVCGDEESVECFDQKLGWEEMMKFSSNPYERNRTQREGVINDTKNNG